MLLTPAERRRLQTVSGCLAAAFATLLVLQAASLHSLERILADQALMESLDWNAKVGVHMKEATHKGQLAGCALGIFWSALLLTSRTRGELRALLLALTPIGLCALTWCVWALTHPSVEEKVRHYGPAALIGLLGILAGLVCPFLAFWPLASPGERLRPGRVRCLLLFLAAILVWTVATLVVTFPIAMAH